MTRRWIRESGDSRERGVRYPHKGPADCTVAGRDATIAPWGNAHQMNYLLPGGLGVMWCLPVISGQWGSMMGLISRGVENGSLVRLRRGAYIPAHRWQALAPWERDVAQLDAHIEGTAGSSVYCLSSAARLLGCSFGASVPEFTL